LSKKLHEDGFKHIIFFREKPIQEVEDALAKFDVKIIISKPSKYGINNLYRIYKFSKIFKPSIVHFHFYPIYTVVNYLRIFSNTKIIYTDHMGGREAQSIFKKILRKFYYYTNSKLFSFGIEKIICVSEFTKLKYVKDYGIQPKNLCVIYNGINTDRFYKKNNTNAIKKQFKIKDEFIITCIGLRKDKGAHCLVKAVPLITKQIPNVKVILVGVGECRNYLENQIKRYNLKKFFLFTGTIRNIEEIYSISSMVVMPSLFEEACPESMATGVPVVAFDSGGTKEVVIDGQTGCIIPRNSRILAEKIIGLYENSSWASMGENGKKRIDEHFSIKICIDNYVNLYKELINKG